MLDYIINKGEDRNLLFSNELLIPLITDEDFAALAL